MAESANASLGDHAEDATRRDFLVLTTSVMGAFGAAAFIWPFIDYMNPSKDVLALSSIEVDISSIKTGQAVTVTWRGKPVFIRRRSPEEISEAEQVPLADLPDPQADKDRCEKSEWLVLVGVCTHLGCVPVGNKPGEDRGEYGGWFCPCHGSHYDLSGRIRKGPAPTNLEVPPYRFLNDTTVKIG